MNNAVKRILTGCLAGGLFLASFLFSIKCFLVVLGLITLWITFVEWPPLVGGIFSWRFFLWTWLYPLLPCFGLMMFVCIAYYKSKMLALYPFCVGWSYDTAAYAIGTLVGRHFLVPTISPRKTWEGLIGGFGAVVLFHYFMKDALPQTLFFENWYLVVLWALLMATLAFVGDLFISKMKRRVSIKDTGTLLPGHGGMLDRFDSVLFVSAGIWLLFLVLSISYFILFFKKWEKVLLRKCLQFAYYYIFNR